MAISGRGRKRPRGTITQLPSGSFRVKVYAGVDAITGQPHYLRETARTPTEAEKVRTRLLSAVDERRAPRSQVTLGMLIDRWLEVADVEESTLHGYRSKVETHIRPTPGQIKLSKMDAELLETFYARYDAAGSSVVAARGPAMSASHSRRPRSGRCTSSFAVRSGSACGGGGCRSTRPWTRGRRA
jgi:hypothetical protein